VKLHHRLDGPADGPLLVLGPSLGTTLDVWQPQMPELTADWRVLRYDLPGHGDSPPAEGFTIDDLVRAVLDLVDEPYFAMGGISVGGAIAATAAIKAPERVRSLVLCCSSARFGEPGPWLGRAALVRGKGVTSLAPALATRWFSEGYDGGWVLDMLGQVDSASYAACCEALAAFDLTSRLPEIAAPTLVVAGADDPATPIEHALTLATGIPGALLSAVPGAAHLASVERADAVTPAILRHLSSTRRVPIRRPGCGPGGRCSATRTSTVPSPPRPTSPGTSRVSSPATPGTRSGTAPVWTGGRVAA
jgi:3-oxoadipate enol-lactonase